MNPPLLLSDGTSDEVRLEMALDLRGVSTDEAFATTSVLWVPSAAIEMALSSESPEGRAFTFTEEEEAGGSSFSSTCSSLLNEANNRASL